MYFMQSRPQSVAFLSLEELSLHQAASGRVHLRTTGASGAEHREWIFEPCARMCRPLLPACRAVFLTVSFGDGLLVKAYVNTTCSQVLRSGQDAGMCLDLV